MGDGGSEAFKGEGVLARAACEVQARAGFEANGIWDLRFQGRDFRGLRTTGCAVAVCDGVLAGVEAETFGESDGGGSWHGRAEALDGWEDLLEEIPFYVRFEA